MKNTDIHVYIPVPRETLQEAFDALKAGIGAESARQIWLMSDAPHISAERERLKLRASEALHNAILLNEEAINKLQALLTAPAVEPCIGKDPLCPCQDGDACHYKDCGDTKAWPVPAVEPAKPNDWAAMIHYPLCWDTAAYPTLESAIDEALAWSGCSVCESAAQPQVQEPEKGENELIWLIEALNKHCGSGFIPHDIEDAFAAYQIATKGTV